MLIKFTERYENAIILYCSKGFGANESPISQGLYDSPLLRFLYSDFRNDPDTLRILLENGADVSVVSNEEDVSRFSYCCIL